MKTKIANRKSTIPGLLLAAFMGWMSFNATADDTVSLVAGNTAFALDLYGRLGTNAGNLFFSPYSISTCLAMTYEGARGATEQQMARTLYFDTNQIDLGLAFGALQRQVEGYKTQSGIDFAIANGLWAEQDNVFLPDFVSAVTNDLQAEFQRVDFPGAAEAVRVEIDQWVSGITKGLIGNLLPPGFVQPTTKLLLVNAIYFKGAWSSKFSSNATTTQPFQVAENQTVPASLMAQNMTVRYFENDALQAVELPYRGSNLTMVALLPKDTGGLSQLEASLTPQALAQWLENMQVQPVDVFLPKFKLENMLDLVQPLYDLGMTNAFGNAADFSGMDGANDLRISGVVHKAYVDVNEDGTEAAAATGIGIVTSVIMWSPPPPVFRADHPFIFLIRDSVSGSIFFIGRLANPGGNPAAATPPPLVFAPANVTYQGLFYDTNSISLDSSGAFSLSTGLSNKFSGKVLFAGRTWLFSGQFAPGADTATVVVKRTHQSDLTLILQLSLSGTTIAGTISDGAWTAQLLGGQTSGNFGAGHPAPQAGDYAMTVLGNSDGTASPGYGSYGHVTVASNGTITLVGLLSDGAIIHQSTSISGDGTWPLFVPLYAGKGALLGWVDFTNQPGSRFNGPVTWVKNGASGPYYSRGFTNEATVLGSIIHH